MTYLTPNRDALAKALYDADLVASNLGDEAEWEHQHETTRRVYIGQAEALLTSGAIVNAATLADDEALTDAVAEQVHGAPVHMDDLDETANVVRALAAALTERGQA